MSQIDFYREQWIHFVALLWAMTRGYETEFALTYVRLVADRLDGDGYDDCDNIITLWSDVVWQFRLVVVLRWVDRAFQTDYEMYSCIDALTI